MVVQQKKIVSKSVASKSGVAVKKQATQDSGQKKSGIKTFKPGDVLFHENDIAQSLYIIQSGQIRLFLPKGRGYVDIAVLRAGEVIGEMAYFDENSRKRSCSASAIITTKVVEISFVAFSKTMSGLNPWFKTIINTLADRLRKTNSKVKQLESNSLGFGKDGKVADYKFLHNTDIVKFLSLFYLTVKTHGELKGAIMQIGADKFKFYLIDIFNYPEAKYEEFMNVLNSNRYLEFTNDASGQPKNISVNNIEQFRRLLLFFNTQRVTADDKKLKISDKCEIILSKISVQLSKREHRDPTNVSADVGPILADLKQRKIVADTEDLDDAITAGLCRDVMVGDNNKLTTEVNLKKIKQTLPAIKLMNALTKLNDSKTKSGGY